MINKRVLSILPCDHFYGGAERNLAHILEGFNAEGYLVTVIIWNQASKKTGLWQKKYPYNYIEIKSKGFKGLLSLIRELKKLSSSIDITLISNITIASIVGLLRRLRIYKTDFFIVRDPSSPFLRYKSFLKILSYKVRYWIGYAAVDFLIFQTTKIRDAFYKNLPYSTPNKVIGNPIDLDSVREKATLNKIKNDKPYIVACGRLIHEKGFDLLIRAFKSSTLHQEYELLILGDGPLKKDLNKLINELRLVEKVRLIGFVENPMPYFKQAKLCVISSRSEGFPNVLFQMMALNSNVLMTKCCGDIDNIPEVKLVEANSISELEFGMKYCITNYKITSSIDVEKFLIDRNITNYTKNILNIIEKHR